MLLIISRAEYFPALRPLVTHKIQFGMPTEVISLGEIRRRFRGRDDAEQVKQCIAWFRINWVTKFVMLVGDADTFPVRYTKTDRATAEAHDTAFYPTDLYYAALFRADDSFDDWDSNGNGYFGELHGETHTGPINVDQVTLEPIVAVGRVPASSIEDVERFVRKVISYETNAACGPWAKKTVLTATHDWHANACQTQERLSTGPLAAMTHTLLFSAGSPCPSNPPLSAAALTAAINQGVGIVGYIGHGGPPVLAIPGSPWDSTQVTQLTNRDMLPVMCVGGCDTADFAPLPPYQPYTDVKNIHHVGTEQGERFDSTPPQPNCYQRWNDPDSDLATTLLVRKECGVVAYFGGVTGLQMTEPYEYFAEALGVCTTLGEAWQQMVRKFYTVFGMPGTLTSPEWFAVARMHHPWKCMLFGDPSLRLKGV